MGKFVELSDRCIGKTLANDISTFENGTLLKKGHNLTASDVRSLVHDGVAYIELQWEAPFLEDKKRRLLDHVKAGVLQCFEDLARRSAPQLSCLYTEVSELIDYTFEQGTGELARALSLINRQDSYTFRHSAEVGIASMVLAYHHGLNKSDLVPLAFGALLHDVGKVLIPRKILKKPDKLNDEEFDIIKKHPQLGVELLREVGIQDQNVLSIVNDHHERFDGQGYPNRKNSNESESFYAGLVSVCDVFFALISDRSYRKGWCPTRAIEYILAYRGQMFDHHAAALFVGTIVEPVLRHRMVRLSDGRLGKIVQINPNMPTKPLIELVSPNSGQINLERYNDLVIDECWLSDELICCDIH